MLRQRTEQFKSHFDSVPTLSDPGKFPRAWIWAVACVLILAGIVYCTRGSSNETMVSLFADRSFSELELNQLEIAFSEAGLSGYRRDKDRMLIPKATSHEFMTVIGKSTSLPYALKSSAEDPYGVTNIFESQSMRKSRIRSARARKLAETITATFNEIAWADVSYDIHDAGGFNATTIQSASVVLLSKDGKPIAPSRISMIQSLVSGAYAGMEPDHVTVTDTSARKTYSGSEDPATRQQRQSEYELEQRLTQLLGGYRGLHVAVRTVEVQPSSETESNNAKPNSKAMSLRPAETSLTSQMHVSVGIPETQFHSQWMNDFRAANPEAKSVEAPSAAELDAAKTKVFGNIREAIRPLLALRDDAAAEAIQVWSYPDSGHAVEYSRPADNELGLAAAIAWARANPSVVVPIGCLVLVAISFAFAATRLRVRSTAVQTTMTASTRPRSGPPPTNENTLSESDETTLRDDLAELVETNPELAAQIVHSWIADAA